MTRGEGHFASSVLDQPQKVALSATLKRMTVDRFPSLIVVKLLPRLSTSTIRSCWGQKVLCLQETAWIWRGINGKDRCIDMIYLLNFARFYRITLTSKAVVCGGMLIVIKLAWRTLTRAAIILIWILAWQIILRSAISMRCCTRSMSRDSCTLCEKSCI